MNWKSWLFLLFSIPIIGFIFWIFSSSVFPKVESNELFSAEIAESLPLEEPLVSFVDPWKGSDSPAITIIEYGDYACPFCRQASETINTMLLTHRDVRFIWKDLPSSLHAGSDIAAEAAHCAKDQGKFWEYHEMLFSQLDVFNHTSLTLSASDLGLDVDRFGKCLSGREKRHLIERSISEAEALNIDGTPYFFVNGKPYSGQMTYEDLLEATK